MQSASQSGAIEFHRGSVVDAAELADFAARTFAETFSADNNPSDLQSHLTANYGLEQQAAELADPLVITILARSNDELVAFAQVRKSTAPTCVTQESPIELHRLYVDRRLHGSGLAQQLMEAVLQAAHEFGASHIWLGVWERNPRAIAYYKKAGFIDIGSTIYCVGPDRQTDRVLAVSLRPPR